jgi:L,D-peptidoglycan transpeptidase YkuD (ErfK/YbiS/YcfS/YnhG family)
MRTSVVVAAVAALCVVGGCAAAARPGPAGPVTTATASPAPAGSGPGPAAAAPAAPVLSGLAPAPRTAAAPRPPLLVEQMADTRGAAQVITVTTEGGAAPVLQAFERAGRTWRRVLGPIPAKIGAQGFSTRVSESTTATPIGLFTLTEAFGTGPDPGTTLPYRQSRYGDVWVDQPSAPTYNTRQSGDADFAKGSGERLWQQTAAYPYAVVIDYNRRPVRAGAGSAFFLHATIPVPSQGCVTVTRDHLVTLLRWLAPAAHPVIALGPAAAVRSM